MAQDGMLDPTAYEGVVNWAYRRTPDQIKEGFEQVPELQLVDIQLQRRAPPPTSPTERREYITRIYDNAFSIYRGTIGALIDDIMKRGWRYPSDHTHGTQLFFKRWREACEAVAEDYLAKGSLPEVKHKHVSMIIVFRKL